MHPNSGLHLICCVWLMCISTLWEPTGKREISEAGNSGLEGQEQNTWGGRWEKQTDRHVISFPPQASGYWSLCLLESLNFTYFESWHWTSLPLNCFSPSLGLWAGVYLKWPCITDMAFCTVSFLTDLPLSEGSVFMCKTWVLQERMCVLERRGMHLLVSFSFFHVFTLGVCLFRFWYGKGDASNLWVIQVVIFYFWLLSAYS